jgi:hypothetical protein
MKEFAMKLVLELSPELESELASEASQLGLPLQEHALRLLAAGRNLSAGPHTGAELVAFWQGEGVVGSRPDIVDAQTHAREIRAQAELRVRI